MSWNRDHLLFLIAGLMIGFVAAYAAFESIGANQPARLAAGAQAPGQGPAPGQPGTQQQGPGFTMADVQQMNAYVEQNPQDSRAVLQLANMNFEIGNWPRAAELYESYLELAPRDPDVLSDLAVSYREQDQHQRALDLLDEAQELDPGHWPSRFNEVIILALDLEDYEAAEATLQELRELRPDDPNVERLATEVERRKNGAA